MSRQSKNAHCLTKAVNEIFTRFAKSHCPPKPKSYIIHIYMFSLFANLVRFQMNRCILHIYPYEKFILLDKILNYCIQNKQVYITYILTDATQTRSGNRIQQQQESVGSLQLHLPWKSTVDRRFRCTYPPRFSQKP